MAKPVKKETVPAAKATSKPAAVKKAAAAKKAPTTKSKKAPAPESKIHLMPATHEQSALLAHRYWAERGHQHGNHEQDWLRAERELRRRA